MVVSRLDNFNCLMHEDNVNLGAESSQQKENLLEQCHLPLRSMESHKQKDSQRQKEDGQGKENECPDLQELPIPRALSLLLS